MFAPAKLLTETHSFITYDIEIMYVPYKTDEENKRYIRTHKPWVIAYRMLDFIDGEYNISNAETFMYTNNFNGVLRRDYNIVCKDCCEKFM
jgi:hypothetical protein